MAIEAYKKVKDYLNQLKSGKDCGRYLSEKLQNCDLASLHSEGFLELLVNTKIPQIFAESAIMGADQDWNLEELSILGDLGIAVPVNIYDNGQHRMPEVHDRPFSGTLLYIPGALLDSCSDTPADWDEVIVNGEVDLESYRSLYERRLLPLLKYANEQAGVQNKKAFITIPGLGCGQFAGPFRGRLGEYLKLSLFSILEKNQAELQNIRVIYYDPYMECKNQRFEIGSISFLVRPLAKGNYGKSQLSCLGEFNEGSDSFRDCEFFSIVAWDQVSWPGNDFFSGSRIADDGVKAAATNSMALITGIEGSYYKNHFKYIPPSEYSCWREVVYKNKLTLKVNGNLSLY